MDDKLAKLRKEADETRHALNNLFVDRVMNSTKGTSSVSDRVQAAQQVIPQSITNRAYLVVLCDVATNAINEVAIWSSPEWQQSQSLRDYYTYVALESSGTSFEDARANLINIALNHLYYYATGEVAALPGTIEKLRSRAGQVTAMRYARLLNYLRDCDAYKVQRVIQKHCETFELNQEFVSNYLTLVDNFLPNIKIKEEFNGLQTAKVT